MAFLLRHLTLFIALALAISLSATPASAQTEAASTFRTFCTNLDGQVDGVFYDLQGQKISLSASNAGLSSPYPRPSDGLVSLYRELPPVPPETKPRRIVIAEARLGDGGPWLLLISAARGQATITAKAIDHSWEKHPVGMIRIFNFSPKRAAFHIADNVFELLPGEDRSVPLPRLETSQLLVKIAAHEGDQWRLRINRPQRIPSADTPVRLTWVLLELPPDEDNPSPRFIIRNLLENAPTPIAPSS